MLKKLLKSFFRILGLSVLRQDTLEELLKSGPALRDLNILLQLGKRHPIEIIKYFEFSKSQLRQDLFVLSHLDFKSGGFFVEFGAADGIYLSNTYILEKNFGWKGILAEPAKRWHAALMDNRTCDINADCVWSKSGEKILFAETKDLEFSTIKRLKFNDLNSQRRKYGYEYYVDTISLEDLLVKYKAPKNIDFLSIDTEGSEFEILSNFSFQNFRIRVITVEHAYGKMRPLIKNLLCSHGYTQVFKEFSYFDDWFVLPESIL